MAGTQVITLRSTDTGAPTLSGQAGKLLDVLDACLVDGYNSKTVQSITRSGQTATVTYATAHGYAADGITKVEISGAAQSEYNGVFVISNVTTTSFDITVTGSPVTPATGTIISKVPPLGWGRPFTRAGNICCYRGAEVTGTRLYLRVDDTGTTAATARGYETMTDLATGVGLFPTVAQMASGVYFNKASAADATTRPWILVGDGFSFHLFVCHYNSSYPSCYKQFYFGDPKSEMASDPYGCLIYGDSINATTNQPETNAYGHVVASPGYTSSTIAHYFARSYTQIGGSIGAAKRSFDITSITSLGANGLPYPSPNNNGLYVSPILVTDTQCIRGTLKGIYNPLHVRPLGPDILLTASESPIGRRLYSVRTPYSTVTYGETHVDIDGPWR